MINMNKNLLDLKTLKLIAFDFDGVFTDNTVYVNQDGVESVRCWRSDGLGVSNIISLGIHVIIVSTETNPVVSARANKLKIKSIQAVSDKAEVLKKLSKDLDIKLSEIGYVGNDINDISALRLVGFPIAVKDSYPEILDHVIYITKKPGGFGAVREICDLIYSSRLTF